MSVSSQMEARRALAQQKHQELTKVWLETPNKVVCCPTMVRALLEYENIYTTKSEYQTSPVVVKTVINLDDNDCEAVLPITYCPFCGQKIEYVNE